MSNSTAPLQTQLGKHVTVPEPETEFKRLQTTVAAYTYLQVRQYTHIHTLYTCMYAHTDTHMHTHTYTHMRAHTHTHTHACTHVLAAAKFDPHQRNLCKTMR